MLSFLASMRLKAFAVAIGRVQMVVVGPSDRPVVAAAGLAKNALLRRPSDSRDHGAQRVGRLVLRDAAVRDRGGEIEREDGDTDQSVHGTELDKVEGRSALTASTHSIVESAAAFHNAFGAEPDFFPR